MATAARAGRCLGLRRRGYGSEHVRRDELVVLGIRRRVILVVERGRRVILVEREQLIVVGRGRRVVLVEREQLIVVGRGRRGDVVRYPPSARRR